jgi:hypothetical protein
MILLIGLKNATFYVVGRNTFVAVEQWIVDARTLVPSHAAFIVLGNKCFFFSYFFFAF